MKQIDKSKMQDITNGLGDVLADMFVLYYKTHAFHWNVEGINFKSLHDLFMAQYTDIWGALDDVAERMRALDVYAPDCMKTLIERASIKEAGQTRDALQMLKELAQDNEQLAQKLSEVIEVAASANDEATADLLTGRLGVHEKAAWMLRASLR